MKKQGEKTYRKFLQIILMVWVLLTIIICFFCTKNLGDNSSEINEQIIELSSTENTVREEGETKVADELKQLLNMLETKENNKRINSISELLIGYILVSIFLWGSYIYFYKIIFRPFDKLNHFAGEISRGNFELPLDYERTNYFGAFTWAFDNMRIEIRRARAAEKAAIENNKTVIATISHDIRTPISSIRAYCEALEGDFVENEDEKREYYNIIMKKCDEVSKLTTDLLMHSLSDLDKLQMNYAICDMETTIPQILNNLSYKEKNVTLTGVIPKGKIRIDDRRLEQVYENLICNAKKYAQGSQIIILHSCEDKNLVVSIRDFGKGVLEEDIPFLFDRFYRGKNANDKEGAGLGLYISKYILLQMGGNIRAKNLADGFEITFNLPIIDSY